MCNMPAERMKIEKHVRKNLGQYFTDRFCSDGSVVKGLTLFKATKLRTSTDTNLTVNK